ncbi:MAG TPA: anion transporter [Spirochaeta sp.]|nr:anion transporter [Spirochaeta sp.]
MKTIFFTGKGGVGKSTLAAAAAWQLAEKGYRVLTVSLDPAHNLGDIFGIKLHHRKKKFTSELYLQETDLEKAADEYIKNNMSIMKEVYGYLKTFNMDKYFSILKYSPGIEEYAALTSLEKILTKEEGCFDYIVFDTPPTGLTLHIFALPGVTLAWIERLIKIRKEILEKRYTIHNIKGKYIPEGVQLAYQEKDDKVIQKLYELQKRYEKVKSVLEGDDNSVSVVFNPDQLSLKESERLLEGLKELGLPVSHFFNNKLTEDNLKTAESVEAKLKKDNKSSTIKRIYYNDDNLSKGYMLNDDIAGLFIEQEGK